MSALGATKRMGEDEETPIRESQADDELRTGRGEQRADWVDC